jgi:hypothetical protein
LWNTVFRKYEKAECVGSHRVGLIMAMETEILITAKRNQTRVSQSVASHLGCRRINGIDSCRVEYNPQKADRQLHSTLLGFESFSAREFNENKQICLVQRVSKPDSIRLDLA